MAQITIGSRIRRSPFHAAAAAAGATHYTIYNRMYMPTSYGDPLGEYERLMTGVSIWDVGAERQVEIEGPDARAFADYVSCRDLSTLKVGRGRYTPMANYDGILINDPIAMPIREDLWWLSIADSDVALFCQGVAGAKGFDVTVREPDVSPLAIQGPKAEDLVRDLLGDIVDEIGFFQFREVELQGIPMVVMRSGWSRQGGFELFLTDGSRGQELWDLAFAAGAAYGVAPGTPHQMERIENGLLSYRSDTDDDTDVEIDDGTDDDTDDTDDSSDTKEANDGGSTGVMMMRKAGPGDRRCKPTGGWGALGKDVDEETCKARCLDTEDCAAIVYEVRERKCSKFAACAELGRNAGRAYAVYEKRALSLLAQDYSERVVWSPSMRKNPGLPAEGADQPSGPLSEEGAAAKAEPSRHDPARSFLQRAVSLLQLGFRRAELGEL